MRLRFKRPKLKHLAIFLIVMSLVIIGLGVAVITEKPRLVPAKASTDGAVKGTGVTGISLGAKLSDFSTDGLLAASNAARNQNSVVSLTLNPKLNNSAQAKCNDMVSKNYWSHITPDGNQPWQFIVAAGYSYTKAGENLAYGFGSNQATIDGWLASPEHKANLLSSAYVDVGFGICESNNFHNSGHQIIIVQHFGAPVSTYTGASRTYSAPAYVASVCTKIPIPYKTTSVDASYLYVGQTQSYGGTDGYTQTCTADSTGYKPADLTIPPYDKTVYVGTKPLDNP